MVCALKVDTYLGRPLEKKKGRKGFEFFITKAKHFRFYKISRRKGKGLLLCRCCCFWDERCELTLKVALSLLDTWRKKENVLLLLTLLCWWIKFFPDFFFFSFFFLTFLLFQPIRDVPSQLRRMSSIHSRNTKWHVKDSYLNIFVRQQSLLW